MFKYRAWKLLSSNPILSETNAVQYLTEVCDLYKGYVFKEVKYASAKHADIIARVSTIDLAIVEIKRGKESLVADNGLHETFFGKDKQVVSAVGFLCMAKREAKEPHVYLNTFISELSEFVDVLNDIRHEYVKRDLKSNLSYTNRKTVPLAKLAEEIIKLTLQMEGETSERVNIYNVRKLRPSVKNNRSAK